MPVVILVIGSRPTPVGKTRASLTLLKGFDEIGLKPFFVKPFAAVNWYENYDLYLQWEHYGKPFSSEFLAISEMGERSDPSEVNPVCAVTSPLRIEYFIESGSAEQIFKYESDFGRSVVLTRVSLLRDNGATDITLINSKVVKREISLLDEKKVRRLSKSSSRINEIWGFNDYADSVMINASLAIKEDIEYLAKRNIALIIEGYGNLAFPVPGLKKIDLVVAVHPGYALLYSPERYLSAVYVKEKVIKGMSAVTFEDVFGLLTPLAQIRLEPVSSNETLETSVRKNIHFVDTVVSLLEKR